jgi:hypothetical protein
MKRIPHRKGVAAGNADMVYFVSDKQNKNLKWADFRYNRMKSASTYSACSMNLQTVQE